MDVSFSISRYSERSNLIFNLDSALFVLLCKDWRSRCTVSLLREFSRGDFLRKKRASIWRELHWKTGGDSSFFSSKKTKTALYEITFFFFCFSHFSISVSCEREKRKQQFHSMPFLLSTAISVVEEERESNLHFATKSEKGENILRVPEKFLSALLTDSALMYQ